MVIGFIILVFFSMIFVGNVMVLIDSNNDRKKELNEVEGRKVEEHNEKFKQDLTLFIIVTFICLIAMAFSVIHIHAEAIKVNSTPETEGGVITESTSAPVKIILPSVDDSIHIDEPKGTIIDICLSNVDPEELDMLACVIYQEVGGNKSCDACRWYVADIVLNRINHPEFPNTMEGVLTAHGQYGLFYWTGIKWAERAKYDVEKDAVDRAYKIAGLVLSGQHSSLYGEGYIWQAGFKQGTDGFWCCGHYYGKG